MTVYLVGAGPGDPGLLTVRGAELLAAADVVLHDQLVAPEVLALAGAGARRVDLGSGRARHDVDAVLVECGRSHRTVVRLHGGDPYVFGCGAEEVQALQEAGVAVEVVPGVVPAFADPAAAGVPVTRRGLADSVTAVSGPAGWAWLADVDGTVVVLTGTEQRAAIADALMAGGRPPGTPVAVVPGGSGARRRSVRTTLAGLADVDLAASATVVVGAVAGLDLRGAPRPLEGRRVVVTRPRAQADPLVRALQQAGAAVVFVPVVAITDPADGGAALAAAARRASRYAWVGFASANAVDRFVGELRDGRDLAGVRLAAVGAATARALARHHLTADLVPAEATAEALAAAFPVPAGDPRPVLLPRAAEGRTVLAETLRGVGWVVEEVEAYRTVAADPHEPAVAAAAAAAAVADVVTFTAPSTVAAFVELVGADRVPPVVVCIGPVTAEAARRAGLQVDAVAADHSASGLVDALVDLEARRAGPAS